MRTAKTDQTGWMPRLSQVFAGRTAILLVLSCHGSFHCFFWTSQHYNGHSLFFNIYRTVAKKNTKAMKINNLSVSSLLPYFVISFFEMCICPPMLLNSSCVSLIWLDDETENKDELENDQINKKTCAPREDSDQPGHLPSLIFTVVWRGFGSLATQKVYNEDSDQTGWSLCWAHMSFC